MDRRALLAALATTGSVTLAGCGGLDDETLDDGDAIELPEGRVTVGHLGSQSSFVDDTTAPPRVHGDREAAYVVLDCDCRDYDAPVTDLPIGVEVNGESVVGDVLVSGAGDGEPRLAFPVPTGVSVDSGAVVFENAYGNERRYPFPKQLRDRIENPPTWRVTVDAPDRVDPGQRARAWTTARTADGTPGRLDALLTHDAATDLHWTNTFDITSDDDATYGFAFTCLCTDRDELTATLDWGLDTEQFTVPVE